MLVDHVLRAIHWKMQSRVTVEEIENVPLDWDQVTKTYRRRCNHDRRLKSEGMKTIDCFHQRVMFAGLRSESGDEGYELLVKKRPKYLRYLDGP